VWKRGAPNEKEEEGGGYLQIQESLSVFYFRYHFFGASLCPLKRGKGGSNTTNTNKGNTGSQPEGYDLRKRGQHHSGGTTGILDACILSNNRSLVF